MRLRNTRSVCSRTMASLSGLTSMESTNSAASRSIVAISLLVSRVIGLNHPIGDLVLRVAVGADARDRVGVRAFERLQDLVGHLLAASELALCAFHRHRDDESELV